MVEVKVNVIHKPTTPKRQSWFGRPEDRPSKLKFFLGGTCFLLVIGGIVAAVLYFFVPSFKGLITPAPVASDVDCSKTFCCTVRPPLPFSSEKEFSDYTRHIQLPARKISLPSS
jgi:hypothetical protein